MNNFETIKYSDQKIQLSGLFLPKKNAPTLILFPAFEGISAFCKDYAQKLSDCGYQVFIADIYGNQKEAHTLSECFSLITPFLDSRELVRHRACLAFDTIKNHPSVDASRMGAFGFCFGGMCTLELLRSGAQIRAAVSLHGVLKKSDLETKKIHSPILILHGFKDPQVPPDSLLEFAEEMKEFSKEDWEFHFFGNAKHSFTDPRTGTFDPQKEKEMGREFNKMAAENSFFYLKHFFDRRLKGL